MKQVAKKSNLPYRCTKLKQGMIDNKCHHPILYAVNARIQLAELACNIGRSATLNDIPDKELDRLKVLGIDIIWLIGGWRTGRVSREVARDHKGLNSAYKLAIPDFSPDDVLGSPYAIAEYAIDPLLGGEDALHFFRHRLAQRDINIILDFVVNHTGLDHRWLYEHPDYYIQGTPEDLAQAPNHFFQTETCVGSKIIAHGRDPYFPPWTDTAQLNLLNQMVRQELLTELLNIAKHCDGVRCDMAMLALPSIIQQIWGNRPLITIPDPPAKGDFWDVAIKATRKSNPDFLLIAEAYWGSESKLQALGFEYIYDKTLYDRLIHKEGHEVLAHLRADPEWQARTVRFLENHDEERVAQALSLNRHMAAAVLVATVPGMLLLHDGQLEGRKVKLPIQLRRRREEPVDKIIQFFYEKLFHALKEYKVRDGSWTLLNVRPAWESNYTWEDFIAYTWRAQKDHTKLVVINYGSTQGQCYVTLTEEQLVGDEIVLEDIMGFERYVRNRDEVINKGIYLDMPAYGFHIFVVHLRTSVRQSS